MTIEMLIGGLIILMMVAVIVVTMTSAKSDSSGGKGFLGHDPKNHRSGKNR